MSGGLVIGLALLGAFVAGTFFGMVAERTAWKNATDGGSD